MLALFDRLRAAGWTVGIVTNGTADNQTGKIERTGLAEATGRTPDQDALALYRLRWALDDVAEFVAWFRAPHGRTPDAEVS
ncbi:hypothetical protein ABGB18_29735 [Nonomuraea sp. B12E4]|uniref:hypothetical protein n=1 Tax=Nonomuraea sp. B12E4 TaxID=3153564 RepID=UPI00325C9E3F